MTLKLKKNWVTYFLALGILTLAIASCGETPATTPIVITAPPIKETVIVTQIVPPTQAATETPVSPPTSTCAPIDGTFSRSATAEALSADKTGVIQRAQFRHGWLGEVAWSPVSSDIFVATSLGIYRLNPETFTESEFSSTSGASSAMSGGYPSTALSPDGSIFAIGMGGIELWSTTTDKLICTLTLPEESYMPSAYGLSFSPDGKRLASAHTDTVRLWDVESGNLLQTYKLEDEFGAGVSESKNVSFSRDGRLLAAKDGQKIHVWNVDTGKLLYTLDHGDVLQSVAFSPKENILASGGSSFVRLWDADTGKLIQTLTGVDYIYEVRFSPDGHTLAAGGGSNQGGRGIVGLWDVSTAQLKNSLQQTSPVEDIAFSPDGSKLVASGAKDLALWNVATGERLHTIEGYGGQTNKVSFSSDGRILATTNNWNSDAQLQLWDSATGQLVRTLFSSNNGEINGLDFNPNDHIVAASDSDGIHLWDINTGERLLTFGGSQEDVTAIALNSDGTRLVSGAGDETIKLWDVSTGKLLNTFLGQEGPANDVAFSPDGNTVASVSSDGTTRLWDSNSGERLRTFGNDGNRSIMSTVSFSSDGRLLMSSVGEKLYLRDVVSGNLSKTLIGPTEVRSAAFSPDGSKILAGYDDGTIWVWDTGTAQPLFTFVAHKESVLDVEFDPKGHLFASSSFDGTAKLWELITP